MDLKEGLLNGDKRAASRLISKFENMDREALDIIRECYSYTGRARIIGITGQPGSGKSTLVDKLTKLVRKMDKKVGIIAVDPTSPFTGGAILGDRIRMSELSTDEGVFIRSMGARGSLGGISRAVYGAVKILDIFGMDYIFVETVGVGQSEVDIVRLADTVMVVLVPGLGDEIQGIKAGIMEIGDIFVVNKADRDGADRTLAEIQGILDLNMQGKRRPSLLKVSALENKGIEELMEAVEDHYTFMQSSGLLKNRRKESVYMEIYEIIKDEIMKFLTNEGSRTGSIRDLVEDVMEKKTDPYSAAAKLLARLNIKEEENHG